MKLNSQISSIEAEEKMQRPAEDQETRRWHKPELTLIRIKQTLNAAASGTDGNARPTG